LNFIIFRLRDSQRRAVPSVSVFMRLFGRSLHTEQGRGGDYISPEGCSIGVAVVFILILKGKNTGAGKNKGG
jgi:hypothetical protein